MEGAMNVDQDMLGGSSLGLLGLSSADTNNNTINVHIGDTGMTSSNHMYRNNNNNDILNN